MHTITCGIDRCMRKSADRSYHGDKLHNEYHIRLRYPRLNKNEYDVVGV